MYLGGAQRKTNLVYNTQAWRGGLCRADMFFERCKDVQMYALGYMDIYLEMSVLPVYMYTARRVIGRQLYFCRYCTENL